MSILRAIHRRLGLKYRVDRCINYVRRFGFRDALSTYHRLWSPGSVQEITVPGLSHRVAVRGGTADASTFEKMFVWNDYDLEYPANVTSIIDAGANTGLSAVFFANRFPAATIVAIEPQQENFQLLQRNTSCYPRIVPLRAALWSDDTVLTLTNPDDRVDSYRFAPEAGGDDPVQAFSVPSILERFGMATIDVLKIDIEGGETAVFSNANAWIDRVRMFIVELHGPDAEKVFAAASERLPARRYRRGENWIVLLDDAR
jgi:FkbM family methyltransferase